MTRSDVARACIRRDHAAGRITYDERAWLMRQVDAAAAACRNPIELVEEHARRRAG